MGEGEQGVMLFGREGGQPKLLGPLWMADAGTHDLLNLLPGVGHLLG